MNAGNTIDTPYESDMNITYVGIRKLGPDLDR